MKRSFALILVIVLALTIHFCFAQQLEEVVIRNIGNAEVVGAIPS